MVMGLQLSGLINLRLGGVSQKFLPKRTGLVGAMILGLLYRRSAFSVRLPELAVILTLAAVKGR